MRPYRTKPLKAWFGDKTEDVKLVITAIEGDAPEHVSNPRNSGLDFDVKYGCSVSPDGRISYFSYDARGAKGGGYPTLPEADQKNLDALLADLPDDLSYLPPANRRLVLQVSAPNQLIARVYDRANPPERILDILRLTRSNIRTWLLTFKPKVEWMADAKDRDGALALARDGWQVVSASAYGPLRFWNPDLRVMLKEVPRSSVPFNGGNISPTRMDGLLFSPDGSSVLVDGRCEIDLLDAQSGKGLRRFSEPLIDRHQQCLSNPHFTPDGNYLLLQSSQPALIIYQTTTWQRVAAVPGMPDGALAYFPAPQSRRSVYLTATGEIALWNIPEKRKIATLDDNGRIIHLAFSPDQSMVAAATLHGAGERFAGVYRVRIWNADNGALVHELRPFEQKAETVEGLLWWPDGKYVLAATKSDNFFTNRNVGIWSVAAGRHRAALVGCGTNISGLALLSDGRLFEGCGDGMIRMWDGSDIVRQVRVFENSLVDAVR
jgi:WD40 repeat protein